MPNGKALGRMMGDRYYDQEVDAAAPRVTVEEEELEEGGNSTVTELGSATPPPDLHTYHPWGIFFTIIGTVLLDFDADACQSPSRAYLLDVTLPGEGKSWDVKVGIEAEFETVLTKLVMKS